MDKDNVMIENAACIGNNRKCRRYKSVHCTDITTTFSFSKVMQIFIELYDILYKSKNRFSIR